MQLEDIKDILHPEFYNIAQTLGLKELRPSQAKSIEAGLFEDKNLLVCTPTASGKTFVAEMAAMQSILNRKGKAIYIVPLRALASEKYKSFKQRYGDVASVGMSIGESDSAEEHLSKHDLIVMTSEKLDSIMRHHAQWLKDVKVVIIDEIHLLNDPGRGPTLEIIITLLKHILENIQIIGLSATIGNALELAEWLEAALVEDAWRPVELKKGVMLKDTIEFVQ